MAGMTLPKEELSMLLSCYLDGALTQDELEVVVSALETDLDAIAEFRRLQEVRRSLRVLPLLSMPLDLLPGGHLGEQISAYLDGELAPDELDVVSEHLASCGECRYELTELDRSRTAVRSLPGLEPPAFLAVARESSASRVTPRFTRRVVAAATGVAAVAFAFTIGPFAGNAEPTAVSITDLQTRHTAVASVPSSGVAVQVSASP